MTSQHELFDRAAAFAKAGRLDDAFKTYRAILKKDPGNDQARYRCAVVELMRGRFREGAKLLRVCLRTQPDNPEILPVWRWARMKTQPHILFGPLTRLPIARISAPRWETRIFCRAHWNPH